MKKRLYWAIGAIVAVVAIAASGSHNQTPSANLTSTPSSSQTTTQKSEPSTSTVTPSTTTTTTEPTTAPTASTPAPASTEPTCTNGSYVNSDGNMVCSPEQSDSGPPAGATAKCNDGSYSFSQHHSGTCSYHGGVAEWL